MQYRYIMATKPSPARGVQVANVNTNNPNTWYTLTYTVPSTPTGGYDMYHPEVNITSGTGNLYVAFNMSWPYTPPGGWLFSMDWNGTPI